MQRMIHPDGRYLYHWYNIKSKTAVKASGRHDKGFGGRNKPAEICEFTQTEPFFMAEVEEKIYVEEDKTARRK